LPPDNHSFAAADGTLMAALTGVVSQACAAILAARAGTLATRTKADRSPVTAADEASEAAILAGVGRLLPGVPIVSEEAACRAFPEQLPDSFVLVDPLDGTRELIAGRDEFSVNLALVTGGRPCLGIVAAPASGLFWRGDARGADRLRLAPGAPASAARDRGPIRTRPWPDTGLVAAVSRSHLDAQTLAFLARLRPAQQIAAGSAVKFCRVAEGAADIYPRLAPVCEWDLAAGHAVLAAAGGEVTCPDGQPLEYGRVAQRLRVPGFIAWGDPAAKARWALSRA
jgi:3'(2'), 5'-bisphosphate nucleotidase